MVASKALLIALLIAAPASAQQSFLSCLDQTQSWSNGFSGGAISAVTYVISMPLAPAPPVTFVRPPASSLGWLIATARSAAPNSTRILVGVAENVARQYQQLTNADAAFASAAARYHELLLIDGTGCPLLIEDAAFSSTGAPLWTH
jgi:hypothetical protein